MITVNNLTKTYNGNCVLEINNLNIAKGESFGLVGNNGAGKTTFFRLILDLIRANGGEVLSKGNNVKGNEEWKNYALRWRPAIKKCTAGVTTSAARRITPHLPAASLSPQVTRTQHGRSLEK